jgi:hypothetical protein
LCFPYLSVLSVYCGSEGDRSGLQVLGVAVPSACSAFKGTLTMGRGLGLGQHLSSRVCIGALTKPLVRCEAALVVSVTRQWPFDKALRERPLCRNVYMQH